ncbi:hypothetical protein [Streptomyces sp. NPDC001381]|uniref:WXG100 family type VII secretion target n=1 Tax=Streptomyces sp. NPDC001381 TaxID=3364567 RepID=UPI0036BDC959
MSGDKKPDEYQAERQDAAQQNTGVDDAVNKAAVLHLAAPGSPGGFGTTSFEHYELNQMIDIVESADPEALESAGKALVDARNAINDAADELSRNLGQVDWEGEAHTAFYTWGMDLTTTALALAGYADEVGTQIMAASSGLASVRKSMPPRDNRTDPKPLDKIPETKRVDSNDEYTAAVTAENHRQEAINQMYRLASFYTVSSGMMSLAEEPVFPKMPDVGVPEPPPGYQLPVEPGAGQGSLSASNSNNSDRAHTSTSATGIGPSHPGEQLPSHKAVDEAVTSPERHIGTEIDSVGTLPPQETLKPTPVTPPSTTGPNVTAGGTPPPFAPIGTPPPVRGATGRTSGFGGMPGSKAPASVQGRAGGVQGRIPAGRTGTGPVGPMGRAAATGQAGGRAAGPVGRGVVGGAPKNAGPAARQVGGTPRGPVSGSGATNPGRAAPGRTGAGRTTDGVIGGKPATGATPGVNGSRVPRGTVVGREGTPASPATGERPGRRGVIGAPNSSTGTGQAPGRPVGNPDGVVGTPKGRTPGARRGPAGSQGSSETRGRRDERPDRPSSTD